MTEPELILGYPALKHLPPLTPRSHQVADQPRLEPSNDGGHIPSQGTQFPVDNSDFFRILSCLKHCHSLLFLFHRKLSVAHHRNFQYIHAVLPNYSLLGRRKKYQI